MRDENEDEAVWVDDKGNVRLDFPTDGGAVASVTLPPNIAIKLAMLLTKQAQRAVKLKQELRVRH
jgi:hypothetical protein